MPSARATSCPMIRPPSAGDTTRATGSCTMLRNSAARRRPRSSAAADGAAPGRIAGSWGCAGRWSGGSGLPGMRQWRGTDQERIRLAASQRPTIPLKLNATDQGSSSGGREVYFHDRYPILSCGAVRAAAGCARRRLRGRPAAGPTGDTASNGRSPDRITEPHTVPRRSPPEQSGEFHPHRESCCAPATSISPCRTQSRWRWRTTWTSPSNATVRSWRTQPCGRRRRAAFARGVSTSVTAGPVQRFGNERRHHARAPTSARPRWPATRPRAPWARA